MHIVSGWVGWGAAAIGLLWFCCNLLKQYKKAKQYLLSGRISQINFKKRQYRAIGYFDGDVFVVVEIDDHQN